MLTKNNSISSSSYSFSTSSTSLQELILQEVQKIKDVQMLFDKATIQYEHGNYRIAYIYFDICVTAKRDEAKYSLSRAICAYSLNVFEITFQDAKHSMKLKELEENSKKSKEIQKILSERLLSSFKQNHKKHLARCKYWMAKSNFAQGDYEQAIKDLKESQEYMSSKKSKELQKLCEERKKQGLSLLFYNTAPSRIRKLFCDEVSILDDKSTSLYHLHNSNKIAYSNHSRSILQHPSDSQLPITFLGSFAIFDRETFLQEKLQLIQKAIKVQQKDFQLRKLAILQQQRNFQFDESSNGGKMNNGKRIERVEN